MTAAQLSPIAHDRRGARGAFYVGALHAREAELTYTLEEGVAVLEHTYVSPPLRQRGLGRALVDAAVAWARSEGLRLHPLCSYARAVFEATPAYDDVRA